MARPRVLENPRNRTINWEIATDEIAKQLAKAADFEGGVSELLERLVIAENKRKRGIAHLHPRKVEASR